MEKGEMSTEKKVKRICFNKDDDLLLAREILCQNPYEDISRWFVIQRNILQITGKNISVRTIKDRIKSLLKKFLAKDRTQQFK